MNFFNKICKFIIGFILFLCLFVMTFPFSYSKCTSTSSDETENENSIVIDELRKSNSFDENSEEWSTPLIKYNEKKKQDVTYDCAFKLVSIGFDDKRNLYVYTCQPQIDKKEFTATSINILYETTDVFDISKTSDSSIKNYDLELVSRSGKFDKYFVVGFNDYTHANEDLERYISFISIFRTYDETIDKGIEIGYTNEVAFPIGEKWHVKEMNGYISYKKLFINYVEITPTISSKFFFKSGFSFKKLFGTTNACDLWYFAFNVDNYVVDHIIDASLVYDMNSVYEIDVKIPYGSDTTGSGIKERIEETEVYRKKELYISDTQQGSFDPTGWFDRKKYTWNRICKPYELIDVVNEYNVSYDNDDSKIDLLTSSQWVFNYIETSHNIIQHSEQIMGVGQNTYDEIERFNVFNVSVLKIKFIDMRGKVHNLGVVADKFTSEEGYTGIINADKDNWERLKDTLEKIGSVIGVILLIVMMIFLLSIFTPIFNIIKLIIKAVWYVISLPFKIIKWVFKRK